MEMLSHPGVQIALFSFPCPGRRRGIDKPQDPFILPTVSAWHLFSHFHKPCPSFEDRRLLSGVKSK
jgi:hypothetical protein